MSLMTEGGKVSRSSTIIILVGAVMLLTGCSTRSPDATRPTPDGPVAGPLIPPVEETCPTQLSSDEVAGVLDAPLLLPHDDLAKGEGEGARLCPNGEVVFYESLWDNDFRG